MKNIKYTEEQIEWLRKNSNRKFDKDFCFEFNKKFNTDKNAKNLRSCCIYYKLYENKINFRFKKEHIEWIKEKSIEEKFRRFKDDFTEDDFVYKRLVRSGDIDVTHHTNNVTYITMLLDTFTVKELESIQWKDIEVSYLNESLEGETLSIYRKEKEDGYYFSIKKEDGKTAVMAALIP